MLRSARRWKFLYGQAAIKNKALCGSAPYYSLLNLSFVLSSRNYCVFHKGSALYGYKGLVGRLAPIFVHLGIILTLLGSVLGFTNGFMAQEMVPSNEVFHVQNLVKSGHLSSLPTNFLARVDDFFLTLNHDNSIQQFFSAISIIDSGGNVLLSKTVSVNNPLKFYGSTFYQTDWSLSALRVDIGSQKKLVKPVSQSTAGAISNTPFWFSSLNLDRVHKVTVVIPALADKLLVYDSQGFLIKTTHYGSCSVIYGVPIIFKDLIVSTGLQIKVDPGVNLAYLGFVTLMISIFLSYASYSQIWSNGYRDMLYFAGETNRAWLTFENEVAIVQKKYVDLTQLTC
jgi:cytochrome c biogenesis protein